MTDKLNLQRLDQDPRLPMIGSIDFERVLYVRLYELFRAIAGVTNQNGEAISDAISNVTTKLTEDINQAIAGAMQKSANLGDVANKTTARSNLGLGTAATRNVGTGSGNVMEVGAFGLGATDAPGGLHNNADLLTTAGFYSVWGDAVGGYDNNDGGLFTMVGSQDTKQIGWDNPNVLRFRGNDSPNNAPNGWSDWHTLYHSGNFSPDSTMKKSANLSDLTNTTTARSNLGLGSAATASVTTTLDDATTGRLIKVGDVGQVGDGRDVRFLDYSDNTTFPLGFSRYYGTGPVEGPSPNGTHVFNSKYTDAYQFRIMGTHAGRAWIQSVSNGYIVPHREIYTTGNTSKNPDGTIKASSPVINLHTDKYDLHNEGQFGATPTVVRKSKGVYEIKGTLGLRSEDWYLDTPTDRNGNKYFNIEWTQNITPDSIDGVVDEYRDDIVVTIETFERVWNKETGLFENGAPMDINELQDRFVQLRFNELRENEIPEHVQTKRKEARKAINESRY